MPSLRKPTPRKDNVLAAVEANPGQNTTQIARLIGVRVVVAYRILPELAAQGLVHFQTAPANKARKKWYPGKKSFLGIINLSRIARSFHPSTRSCLPPQHRQRSPT